MHSNDAQMLVLTVLAGGPRHGYAINAAIEELTGARLGPGSLYGALSRLEARGLVQADDQPAPDGAAPDPRPGPSPSPNQRQDRQRTVRITDAGRQALRVELEQMARVSRAGLRALGIAPG